MTTTENPAYWSKTLCGCRTSYAPYEFLIYACSIGSLWPTIFDAMYVFSSYTVGPCIILCLLWMRVVLYAPSTFERYRTFLYLSLLYFTLQYAVFIPCSYFLITVAYHPGYIGINAAGLVLITIGSVCSILRLATAKDDTITTIINHDVMSVV